MAKFNSKVSTFDIQDVGGQVRDMSTFLTSIDGLPGEVERPETTALGDDGRRHILGLENVTVTLEGFYDDTVTSGPDETFGGLRSDDVDRPFQYGPKGSTSGFVRYYGDAKVRNYVITSRVGENVTFRSELLVQGVVTRGTF